MKKLLKILKISLYSSVLLMLLFVISMTVLLEPEIKISGFEQLDESKLRILSNEITILDDDNNVLDDELYKNSFIYVPIEKVNQTTRDAFVSIEDRRFYEHSGVDVYRVASAAKNDILSMSYKEGASTITQQLVKNTHLSSEKNMTRKLQEIRIARDVERKFSKDEILEMYMNILYFGNNIYGIGTASRTMFNKNPNELTIAQSALLAGIINNPYKYNPYTNLENAKKRRDLVLSQMLKYDKINSNQFETAINEEIELCDIGLSKCSFLSAVNEQANEILKNYNHISKVIIETDIDTNAQNEINKIMNEMSFGKDILAHVLVLNNLSGQIVADHSFGEANFYRLKRQPASTIKPIICYAPALEKNIIFPITPINDTKCSFGDYTPSNYGDKYYGWISAEQSLKNSSNICAIKLMEMNGIDYSKSFAQKCGYNFSKSDNSLTLALGGLSDGVTLQTIANSYQPFANNGKFIKSSHIKSIKTLEGKILYTNKSHERRVMSEETAYFMNSMLSECAKDGTARRLKSLGENICAKTGTVGNKNGNTDAYCIAFNPEFTVAVWIGSKNNNCPNKINGGGRPSELAKRILKLFMFENADSFYRPKTIVEAEIDAELLNTKHKLVLADESLPMRYKKTAEFPIGHLPKKQNYLKNNSTKKTEYFDVNSNYGNYEII